jgi:hypothetical protein
MKNNSSNLSTDNLSHKKVGTLRHSSSKPVQALTAHLNVAYKLASILLSNNSL